MLDFPFFFVNKFHESITLVINPYHSSSQDRNRNIIFQINCESSTIDTENEKKTRTIYRYQGEEIRLTYHLLYAIMSLFHQSK